MARLSENAVSFFGAGGHKHDGATSSLISTASYSLFDFKPGYIGAQSRISIQQDNQTALEDWVISIVNNKVLSPAGLDLAPGLLSGKSIRANTITATELQANTITADEIAANAVTANELAANLVLVNNVIRSNNYDGTIASNNVITSNGTAGWAITSSGQAEFDNAVLRGNVTANAGSIGGWAINTSSIAAGNTTLYSNGVINATNAIISGAVTATSGSFTGSIYAGSGTIGGLSIGSAYIQSTDYDASNGFRINSDGTAYFNEITVKGTVTGSTISGSTISGSTLTSDTGSQGIQITGGYIKGLYSAGIEFRGSSGSSYTYINGGNLTGSKLSVSDGTNDWYVDSSGGVGVLNDMTFYSGTASDSGIQIKRSGTANMSRHMTFAKSDGTYVGAIRYANGDNNKVVFVGDITGTSDIRLKENIESLTGSLEIVKKINPVKFNFIRSPEILENGFIAQELYQVYPFAVEEGGENPIENPWTVLSPRLIPILVGSIKELASKVDALETRIKTLEGV